MNPVYSKYSKTQSQADTNSCNDGSNSDKRAITQYCPKKQYIVQYFRKE